MTDKMTDRYIDPKHEQSKKILFCPFCGQKQICDMHLQGVDNFVISATKCMVCDSKFAIFSLDVEVKKIGTHELLAEIVTEL